MSKNTKEIIYILIIVIISIVLLLQLFINPRYAGHDTVFHVSNIIELSKTISIENIFGNRIVSFECNEFGYGVGFFYPRLPHLVAAYLNIVYQNVYASMDSVYLITLSLSGIAMFFLSKKIFKDEKIALISAIIYLTIPYHISEIYVRDAFAENFMFLAVPLIFLGLYYLKDNDYKKFYFLFVLGYVIGIYSHLVSMVFCTIIVGFFILYNKNIFLKRDKIIALIKSTLIVIGFTIPFLIMVIEYKLLNTYTVFLSENFVDRNNVINATLKLEQYFNQVPMEDSIKPYLNYTTLILFAITTIKLLLNKTEHKKELITMLIMMGLLVCLISSKLFWTYVPDFFIMIQFPWRLLVILSVFVALYAPICLTNKINLNNKSKTIFLGVIISFILIEGLGNVNYCGRGILNPEYASMYMVSMGHQLEYLPIQTQKIINYEDMDNSIKAIKREEGIICRDDKAIIKITQDEFPNLTFSIDNIEKDVSIELPRVYYLGYVLKDEKGNKIDLFNTENGFLGANIEENGIYELYHTNTIPELIANIICLFTFGICVVYIIKCTRCQNK